MHLNAGRLSKFHVDMFNEGPARAKGDGLVMSNDVEDDGWGKMRSRDHCRDGNKFAYKSGNQEHIALGDSYRDRPAPFAPLHLSS